MRFRKILSVLMAMVCLCASLCVTAYAEEADVYIPEDIVLAYEIASSPSSSLGINGATALCDSSTRGSDCVGITVTHTLQKYSGILWLWNDVNNATWSKTVSGKAITLSTSKSGLENGTYRLKSTFTLTSSSGNTETITIYSTEKKIG